MPINSPLDAFLGHNPEQEISFIFIDDLTGEVSSTQHWPIVPAVGDKINLRNGSEWVVTRRVIHYDAGLSVDVFVTTKA
jgi:hypothetical protein